MAYRDLVKQSATVNGTGAFTLGAAVSGEFQTMHVGRTIGEEIEYTFVKDAQSETGIGTLTGANTLARTTVVSSSNGGALVNFAAGTGEIRETVTSKSMNSFASVRDIPFAAAIPLTRAGLAYMADKTVNAPLTFTAAANAVRGALVYLRLIADGANLPNFSAFKEWGGSSGYDNRNGIVNQVQFFYDGADLFYSASQAVSAVPAAPAATGVTMTGPTAGTTGAASSNFALGVTPVGGTVNGTVRITPVSTVPGDTFAPAFRDVTTGAPTGTFTLTPSSDGPRTISAPNNGGLTNPATITYTASAAAASTVRLTGAKTGDVTESASAPWTYTSTGGATGATGASYLGAIPAATDGEVIFKVVTKSADFMVGVSTTSGTPAYNNGDTESIWSNGGNSYRTFGTAPTTSATGQANGDLIRFRKFNSSGSADFRVGFDWSVSKDNGTSWTIISANTVGTNGLRTQPYYFRVVPGSGAVLSVVSQTGFA